MKIQHARKTIEDLLAESHQKSERKVYAQLLAVLGDLSRRDLSLEQLEPVEAALDRLFLETRGVKELKRSSRQFMKSVRTSLSLVPEGHYTALGLAFGVAVGASLGSALHGFTGISMGTSATGLGVGIGLIAGYLIGLYLDVEAAKQNRVLRTSTE
ncbi:MAG: hypothetical protein MUC91_05740 [Verrucomicrobia bacterium]|jgi:hypothetical protein|nr:hypothetical protein [Verrucomicrobiota bacterium]